MPVFVNGQVVKKHKRDCPKCRGRGWVKQAIPVEKRPTVCYDHWDTHDYVLCDVPGQEVDS